LYVCICERVRESEVRSAITGGARCEQSVGDACGAGTGCGTCLDRICELIAEETGDRSVPAQQTKPQVGGLVPVNVSRLAGLRSADTLTTAAA
jgi:bacterioferritin-associated ferredoxin